MTVDGMATDAIHSAMAKVVEIGKNDGDGKGDGAVKIGVVAGVSVGSGSTSSVAGASAATTCCKCLVRLLARLVSCDWLVRSISLLLLFAGQILVGDGGPPWLARCCVWRGS